SSLFLFRAPPPSALYALSLHDALPIFAADADGWSEVSLRSSFLRVDDLAPIIAVLDGEGWASVWLELEPRGDFTRLDATWRRDGDRKSTRLNSSHVKISYAVFCLKKKK